MKEESGLSASLIIGLLNTLLISLILFGSAPANDIAKTLSGRVESNLRADFCRKVIDLEYKASSYVADAKLGACKKTVVFMMAEANSKRNKTDRRKEIEKLEIGISNDETEIIDFILTICKNIDFSRDGHYTDGFDILSEVLEEMGCP